MTPIFEKPPSENTLIWAPWQKTEDGVVSSLREALLCSWLDHDAGPNDDRCKRCGARRSKTIQKYPGVKGNDGDPKPRP